MHRGPEQPIASGRLAGVRTLRRPLDLAALTLAFVAGAGIAVQVFLNGRLGGRFGSAELAGTVSNGIACVVLGTLAAAVGAPRRALRRLRASPVRLRWWQVAAGVNGGFFLLVAVTAAPKVGVALVTVATVCGQSVGSLLVDRIGMSPAGVRPITAARLLGVVLALGAVVLGALGSLGGQKNLAVGLLVLAVLAGAGVAIQQAALGHVAGVTGEPLIAGALNFSVGLILLVTATLVVTGTTAPHGWSAPAIDWLGGVIAAGVAFTMARTVSVLGVLRLTLAVVAGQSTGALAVDIVAPARGETITVLTVVSVLLTLVAVYLSGLATLSRSSSASARRRAARSTRSW